MSTAKWKSGNSNQPIIRITKDQVALVESKMRCHHMHAGNRRVTFATGFFECNGCGQITLIEDALWLVR